MSVQASDGCRLCEGTVMPEITTLRFKRMTTHVKVSRANTVPGKCAHEQVQHLTPGLVDSVLRVSSRNLHKALLVKDLNRSSNLE